MEYFSGDMVQRLRKEEREEGGKGRWFPKIERFSAETYLGYGTVRKKEREGEKDMSNPSL